MNITATCLRTNLPKFNGSAHLYKLSERVSFYDDDGVHDTPIITQHVVVSAVNNAWATETFIFPSSPNGSIMCWLELPGSFRGSVNHERAINGLLNYLNTKD